MALLGSRDTATATSIDYGPVIVQGLQDIEGHKLPLLHLFAESWEADPSLLSWILRHVIRLAQPNRLLQGRRLRPYSPGVGVPSVDDDLPGC